MVGIIDYGMGNLRSVQKACEYLGHEVIITSDPSKLLSCSHIILPGVGAFAKAIKQIKRLGLDKTIKTAIDQNIPLLGICLGMQLLFESSTEGGTHAGLGIINSKITRFSSDVNVPHMGWNSITPTENSTLFKGLTGDIYVYFVHSYIAAEINSSWTAATSQYGAEFTCAIEKGKVFATQFHPEKSGDTGLKILSNFLAIGG